MQKVSNEIKMQLDWRKNRNIFVQVYLMLNCVLTSIKVHHGFKQTYMQKVQSEIVVVWIGKRTIMYLLVL